MFLFSHFLYPLFHELLPLASLPNLEVGFSSHSHTMGPPMTFQLMAQETYEAG